MKLTPLRAIRKICLECCYGSRKEIADCPIKDCPLYKYRNGRKRAKISIIRRYCRGCAENSNDIRDCDRFGCPAWAFRGGRKIQATPLHGE